MAKKDLIIIADYSQKTSLTSAEFRDICNISPDLFNQLIEYQIIHVEDQHEGEFDLSQVKRAKIALRLQRDLEVNLAGAAVVLDLLEEMERLHAQMELWERHFLNL
jgi:chaperone modulatory protein CbpM